MQSSSSEHEEITLESRLEAGIIVAITERYNFFDTFDKMNFRTRKEFKEHSAFHDLLVSNFFASGRQFEMKVSEIRKILKEHRPKLFRENGA